jgi:hypothetical protein
MCPRNHGIIIINKLHLPSGSLQCQVSTNLLEACWSGTAADTFIIGHSSPALLLRITSLLLPREKRVEATTSLLRLQQPRRNVEIPPCCTLHREPLIRTLNLLLPTRRRVHLGIFVRFWYRVSYFPRPLQPE